MLELLPPLPAPSMVRTRRNPCVRACAATRSDGTSSGTSAKRAPPQETNASTISALVATAAAVVAHEPATRRRPLGARRRRDARPAGHALREPARAPLAAFSAHDQHMLRALQGLQRKQAFTSFVVGRKALRSHSASARRLRSPTANHVAARLRPVRIQSGEAEPHGGTPTQTMASNSSRRWTSERSADFRLGVDREHRRDLRWNAGLREGRPSRPRRAADAAPARRPWSRSGSARLIGGGDGRFEDRPGALREQAHRRRLRRPQERRPSACARTLCVPSRLVTCPSRRSTSPSRMACAASGTEQLPPSRRLTSRSARTQRAVVASPSGANRARVSASASRHSMPTAP